MVTPMLLCTAHVTPQSPLAATSGPTPRSRSRSDSYGFIRLRNSGEPTARMALLHAACL
jgi:hypothetical protein